MKNNTFKFNPKIKTIGTVELDDISNLKNETMFWRSSVDFVRSNRKSSRISNLILDKIEEIGLDIPDGYSAIIDSRVNLLMPGYYSSIPGWHCDYVPRGSDGQPDLTKIDNNVKHILVLVSENEKALGTEFVTNQRDYIIDKSNVWNSLDTQVESDKGAKLGNIKNLEIVQFDQKAIHRVVPATSKGYRLLFRLSILKIIPKNEIRNQTQVYVDVNNSGW